jgi:hypothetical protein
MNQTSPEILPKSCQNADFFFSPQNLKGKQGEKAEYFVVFQEESCYNV